ncbi:hypothetical protein PGW94_04080 [Candidatus Anaplasma sp. TIGMIC]|nr:hypothetical protein [Candidatus Anaplasma sp. TIGMIC]
MQFVSPDSREEFGGICSLVARTRNGEFVVMANHEKAVMDLSSHIVILKDEKGGSTVIAVSSAVLSVENNVCTIVADRVILPGKTDSKEKLKGLREEVERVLSSCSEGILAEQARADLEFIHMVLAE